MRIIMIVLFSSSIATEYEKVKMDPKNDRAEHRRQKVGSSCDYEKTKTASLNTYVQSFRLFCFVFEFVICINIANCFSNDCRSIASDNKGFKMLSKLGWNEGQSLGKNSDGILEPVRQFAAFLANFYY